MDIIAAARDGGCIDEFAHMTPDQIKSRKAEKSLALGGHDPAAYNFEKGQDVTLIHGGNAAPQLGSGASIGASQYSIVTRAREDGDQLEDEEDELTQGNVGSPIATPTVGFAMVNKDGEEEEVLRLPVGTRDNEDGMDLDSEDGDEDEEDDDDQDSKLLTHLLWMAAPDDLPRLEGMLDQLELEHFGGMEGIEVTPGISALLTEDMRTTLVREAAEAELSLLEYIQELRSSLHRTHGKSEEEEDEKSGNDPDDDSQNEYMSLPDSDDDDIGHGTDNTGLPQGSGNNAPQEGAGLSTIAGNSPATGNDIDTAQTGGTPG